MSPRHADPARTEDADARPTADADDAGRDGERDGERDAASRLGEVEIGPDGRRETRAERFDRNWADILQELRSVQTSTTIITGFLLAVAFQPAFQDLDGYQVALYLVLVVLAGFATLLGLAPVILHRQLFGKQQKERLVQSANRMLFVLLGVVSVLAVGVISLIFDVAVSRPAGFVALAVGLVAVIAFWLVVPRLPLRERD